MSYLTISQAAASFGLEARVAACIAQETGSSDPWRVAVDNMLRLCAEPGWGEAWASALAAHPRTDPEAPGYDPGTDEAVITDQMILAAVQAHLAGL